MHLFLWHYWPVLECYYISHYHSVDVPATRAPHTTHPEIGDASHTTPCGGAPLHNCNNSIKKADDARHPKRCIKKRHTQSARETRAYPHHHSTRTHFCFCSIRACITSPVVRSSSYGALVSSDLRPCSYRSHAHLLLPIVTAFVPYRGPSCLGFEI
jgi:hypothetical protein